MSEKNLQYFDIFTFQQNLLDWYQKNKRDLPWRNDQDPYKIWVSEIMLQQTKVDTVIPYFNRFITRFPTIYDLAKADSQAVLKAWEGLGFYSRARNLHHAVREVVATYDGRVPENPDELGALKGVGPYTKGAILSIAFQQPEPAVDGNVMRVLSRILKIKEDISQQRVKRLFEVYARKLISSEDPSSFNQGIMELGALVCTPKSPMCMLCPVQTHCKAFAEGIAEDLPIKTKTIKKQKISYIALLIRNERNQYAIEKRPKKGLLADLWQFPMIPIEKGGLDHIENWMLEQYGLSISLNEKKGKLKHVFSHLVWQLEIYDAKVLQYRANKSSLNFVEKRDLRAYPFPVSHLNMMKFLSNA